MGMQQARLAMSPLVLSGVRARTSGCCGLGFDYSASANIESAVRPLNLPKSVAELDARVWNEMRAAYDAATGEAKKQACEKLKAQFPSDPNVQALNCSTAGLGQIATALGYAAGAALCAASGAGAVTAAVCGSFGAWFGNAVGTELFPTLWQKIKTWDGVTGTITGGWEAMPLYDKFLSCYGTKKERYDRGYWIAVDRFRESDPAEYEKRLKAWGERCDRYFPNYTPVYPSTPTRPGMHIKPGQVLPGGTLAPPSRLPPPPTTAWYKNPRTYVAAGGAAVVGVGIFALLRMRGRR